MLKLMRTGAQSIVLKVFLFGLLLLAMGGLAIMDVQGMFRRGVSDTTVARVNGTKISVADFERMVSGSIRRQNIPEAEAIKAGLPQQILSQEINGRLYASAADDLGLLIDDRTVAKAVRDMIKPLTDQGMPKAAALNRVLNTTGLTEPGLVAALRAQTATDTLLRLVTSGAHAPQQLVDDALKFKYEARKGEYFIVRAADARAAAPTEDELKAYYKTISTRFALPEYRSLSVLVLDRKALGIKADVPEADLKKYYDDHKSDYGTPETRVVTQVVASDENAAKAVYESAAQSKDLQKAAEAAGKGKANYIRPQTYAEKDMPVELSPAAFKAQAGAVLPPVRSALGWHILHVQKINPGTGRSFDSVKTEIEKDLTADKSAEALYEQSNKIDDMLAGGKTLEDVAKQFNLKPIALDKIDAHGNAADGKKPAAASGIPAFDKVLDHAFRLAKGDTSQLIEAPTGEFLAVSAQDIIPSADAPFEKTRDAVRESWTKKQTAEAADKLSEKIAERLKLGESFDRVAASSGKTAIATGFVTRANTAEKEKLPHGLISALFELNTVGITTSYPAEDGVVVLRLADRRIDMPATQSKEDTAALRNMLDRALRNDILDEYRAHLIEKYDVTINDKLVRAAFRAPGDEAESE